MDRKAMTSLPLRYINNNDNSSGKLLNIDKILENKRINVRNLNKTFLETKLI